MYRKIKSPGKFKINTIRVKKAINCKNKELQITKIGKTQIKSERENNLLCS